MKTPFRLSFMFSIMALTTTISQAQVAVQRTVKSSLKEYHQYLEKTQNLSFVDAYLKMSSKLQADSPTLENCLEEIYISHNSSASCLAAVKALTNRPLNSSNREILFSLLLKISKIKSSDQDFYRQLKDGLLQTDSNLALSFHLQPKSINRRKQTVSLLESKAWKKGLSKSTPLSEVRLLINGEPIQNLSSWSAPQGVYQWSLITNTHEPIIRLSTFSQFAADSLQNLKPLALDDCHQIETANFKKYGLLQVEVFAGTQCIAKEKFETPEAPTVHLGNVPNSPEPKSSESFSHDNWLWPTLAMVGVGLAAAGLKGKNVSVQWPGSK